MDRQFMNSEEAAAALGVSRETLYAYASRGQLRSEPTPGHPRERRYCQEDIRELVRRKEGRRDPAKAAAHGLNWGAPVMPSSITLIQDGQLYYRGQDATKLAAWASLEQIAELLWEQTVVSFEAPQIPAGIPRLEDDPIASFQAALPLCGSQDLSSFDLRPEAFAKTGARIVRLLATIAAGRTSTEPVHRHLLSAWAPECEDAGEAIRAAMVLCADHELNVSAFVARCAASAACAPYDVVSAALATLKGQRHGGQSEASTRLIAEAASAPSISRLLHNRLRSGEGIPGFGHQLYPAGDPRAKFLLSLAERSGREEEWSVVSELRTTAAAILDEAPNLDFGLAALAHVYRLPEHAPLVLFAIGRTVGWIAHAIEQTQTPHLIRPRAHYTGPPPDG